MKSSEYIEKWVLSRDYPMTLFKIIEDEKIRKLTGLFSRIANVVHSMIQQEHAD